jgi:hypothetical protein
MRAVTYLLRVQIVAAWVTRMLSHEGTLAAGGTVSAKTGTSAGNGFSKKYIYSKNKAEMIKNQN